MTAPTHPSPPADRESSACASPRQRIEVSHPQDAIAPASGDTSPGTLSWLRAHRQWLLPLLTVGILELTARVVLSNSSVLDSLTETDTVLTLMWINDRHRGDELYQTFEQPDQLLGWRPKPGLRDFPAFDGKRISTNSEGFRGVEEFTPQRTNDRSRLVVLGDSFTFGDEGDDDEIWPYFLQHELPDTDVLNLGVSGYGVDQMLIYLEEVGLRFSPDVVIVGVFPDDLRRAKFSFFSNAKPRFEVREGRLELTGVPVRRPESIRRAYRWRPRALDLFAIAWETWRSVDEGVVKYERETVRRILGRLARSARQSGSSTLLVYLPTGIDQLHDTTEVPSQAESELMRLALDSGAGFCNVRDAFRPRVRAGRRYQPAPRGHWRPDAHRVVAEHVARCLREGALLPRSGHRRLANPPAHVDERGSIPPASQLEGASVLRRADSVSPRSRKIR